MVVTSPRAESDLRSLPPSDGGLHAEVRAWLHRNGRSLRPLQAKALPLVRRRTPDVLISAPTASGKTEAAALPIFSHLLDHPGRGFRAIWVSPTRALIDDLYRRLFPVEGALGIPIHRLHGDVETSARGRLFREPAGILLTTPESLENILLRRHARLASLFGMLDFAVIDELHLLMESERGAQVRTQLDRLERALDRRISRIGLSATMGDMDFAAEFLRGPGVVRVCEPGVANEKIGVDSYPDRTSMALDLLRQHGSETHLAFATSKLEVELLCDELRQMGGDLAVFPHHAGLSGPLRREAERHLTTREEGLCICTSTLEVGIDLPQVNSVSQIGAPNNVSGLRQRMGRSGRRGQSRRLLVRLLEPELRNPLDCLDAELVQSLAVCEAMQAGVQGAVVPCSERYSTLLQQLLSHLYANGLCRRDELASLLLTSGLWRHLSHDDLDGLLSYLQEQELLVLSDAGEVALCPRGVELVLSPGFATAFCAPAALQVFSPDTHLGQVAPRSPLQVGDPIILGGRRWQVTQISEEAGFVRVRASAESGLPFFLSSSISLEEGIPQRMRRIYQGRSMPVPGSPRVRERLAEARRAFRELGLAETSVLPDGACSMAVTWAGGRVNDTLVALLAERGVVATGLSMGIWTYETPEGLRTALSRLEPVPAEALAEKSSRLEVGKFDSLLPRWLLVRQRARCDFDVDGALAVAARIAAETRVSG